MKHRASHLLTAIFAALFAALLLAACSPKPLEERDLVAKLRRSDAFLPGGPEIDSYEVLDRSTDRKNGTDALTVTVRTGDPVEAELTYDLTFDLKDDDWKLTSVERAEDGPWTIEGPSRRELTSAAQERDEFLREHGLTDVTVETASESYDFDPEDATYAKTLTLSLTAPYEDAAYNATVKASYALTEDGWELDRWETTGSGLAVDEDPDDPGPDDPGPSGPDLDYASGTSLRMAVGYNSVNTGISFDARTAEGGVTLANGVTYYYGDLKPAWQELADRLSLDFVDVYQGNSAANEYQFWAQQLDQVDILMGASDQFNGYGPEGAFVDLADYLDDLPNLRAFLAANSVSWSSLLSPVDGGLYCLPFADGINDVTRVPLMRTDWVEKLLNGSGQFTAGSSGETSAPVYQPYMPTSGKVTVDVVKPDGSGVGQITKDYDAAGNIVAQMNARGSMSGVDAVNMLRDYIDKAYNGYYGTNRADLFIGQNAAWDADELVALLRCVVANPQTLNGADAVQGLFVRQTGNSLYHADLIRLAGQLFGVRGLDSNFNYDYVGADGVLHDARMEPDAYEAMERMNAMAREGLIAQPILDGDPNVRAETFLAEDSALMEFDYSQSQTMYNVITDVLQAGETFRAVLTPVARWNDGAGEAFFRFAENWRDVKSQAIGISRLGINGDQNKLNAALTLFDYLFSKEGQILMNYGPIDFTMLDANTGDLVTFDFNGETWPQVSDAAYREAWDLCDGYYTNYCRKYLGTTIIGLKAQALEFQYTCPAGQEGMRIFSNAIGLGVLRHPELSFTDDPWYTTVPTVLPLSETQQETVNAYPDLFDQFSQSIRGNNVFLDIIVNGYSGASGFRSADDAAQTVSTTYGGAAVLSLYNEVFQAFRSAFAD